jgi:hypothetical protein
VAETVEAFVAAFSTLGYRRCPTGALEPGVEKVAIFVDTSGTPTHAARQLENGAWTSKLGKSVDIEHRVVEGVSGPLYGTPATYLGRTREQD